MYVHVCIYRLIDLGCVYWVCVPHTSLEVRGQLVGVGSLLPCDRRNRIQVLWVGRVFTLRVNSLHADYVIVM